jgi:hypothetical protein
VKALLVDLVNYGSNLIPRCFISSSRGLQDAIIIGVLLRQVVAMIDASEVLVSNAAVYASHAPARVLFETSIFIEWILRGDTEEKARYFYVANLRRDRVWALRAIGKAPAPDQSEFEEGMKEFSDSFIEESKKFRVEAEKQLIDIDRILSQDVFKPVNEHFEKHKKRRRLSYEPDWYSPLGINSVRRMAKEVNRLGEYDFIYSKTSRVIHGSRYRDHISFGDGKLRFEPVRSLMGISFITNFVVSSTLRTYMRILEYYRPMEVPALRKKYSEDWRRAFRNVKTVKYTAVGDSVIL